MVPFKVQVWRRTCPHYGLSVGNHDETSRQSTDWNGQHTDKRFMSRSWATSPTVLKVEQQQQVDHYLYQYLVCLRVQPCSVALSRLLPLHCLG